MNVRHLAVVAVLAAGLGVAPATATTAPQIQLKDVSSLIGHLGSEFVSDPTHAANLGRSTAATFLEARNSVGAGLRAQASSLGLELSSPNAPITTDLVAALQQADAFAGAHRNYADLRSKLAHVPVKIQSAIADIVSAMSASIPERARAFSKLTTADLLLLQRGAARVSAVNQHATRLSLIAGATPAAVAPFAARKALLSKIDMLPLLDACVRVADAVDRSVATLHDAHFALGHRASPPIISESTPYGDIVVKGTGDDVNNDNAFILIDLGGNNTYVGNTAAATGDLTGIANDALNMTAPSPAELIAATQTRITIDLGNKDTFNGGSDTQGFGSNGGLGILVHDGNGPSSYSAGDHSQGVGVLAGVGILSDSGASNSFSGNFGVQGFSDAAGVGLLIGGTGRDSYTAFVFSQGTGFDGGAAATLVDLGGSNSFVCTGEVDTANVILPVSQSRPSTGCHGTGFGGQGALIDGGTGNHYYVQTSFQAMALIGAGLLVSGGKDFLDSGEWSNGLGVLGAAVVAIGPGDSTFFSNERTPSYSAWIDIYLGSNGEGYEGVGVFNHASGNDAITSVVDKTRFLLQIACGIGCAYGGVGVFTKGTGNDSFATEVGEGAGVGGYAVMLKDAGDDTYSLTDGSTRGQGYGEGGGPLGIFCGVGYLVHYQGNATYSNPVTTFGHRGHDQRWEQNDFGRGMDGQAGIQSYITDKLGADIHLFLQDGACVTPLPIP
ncbi:MAG: hypothetical protein ACYDCC_13750 [Actinomycetota bacterium]